MFIFVCRKGTRFYFWMKKLITVSCFLFATILFIGIAVTQSSCAKDTDCTVDIFVVDTTTTTCSMSNAQIPVAGASVKLYANIPNATVQATGTTDNSGHVHFTFKLPAIFDIKVSATVCSLPMAGTGLIQLNVGGNASATVLIH